jgi:hypothetical protein
MLFAGGSVDEREAVREQDRAAQGLDQSAKHQAEGDLQTAECHNDKLFVECPHGINAFHSDFLFGKAEEWLFAGPFSWE